MSREFGYRRGALNLVNWVSDRYSQYGTKVVSVAEREAIHTLEAILHTQLPIVEHTADTHGTTEIVFALFDLLGLGSSPASATSATCSCTASACPRACRSTWCCALARDRSAFASTTTTCSEQPRRSSAAGSPRAC
jgi:hypothetical protein